MRLFALFRLAGMYRNCVPDPFLSVPWGPLGLDDPQWWVPPSSFSSINGTS